MIIYSILLLRTMRKIIISSAGFGYVLKNNTCDQMQKIQDK